MKNLRVGLGFQLIENLGICAGIVVPELDFDRDYAAYVLLKEPGESLVLSATFLFGELFAPTPAPRPR